MSLPSPIGLVGIWFASLVTVVGYQQTGTSATAQNALQAVVRAAEAGNRDAQFALDEWFRKAADNGHAKPQFMAGLAFMAGKSVERDVLRGLDRFRQAADQGYAPAQYAVA